MWLLDLQVIQYLWVFLPLRELMVASRVFFTNYNILQQDIQKIFYMNLMYTQRHLV